MAVANQSSCVPLDKAKAFFRHHKNDTIINCGLGTTGTTFLFKQACAIGMTAVHNGETCNLYHEQIHTAKEMWAIYDGMQKCSYRKAGMAMRKKASLNYSSQCKTNSFYDRLHNAISRAARFPPQLITDTPWANECFNLAKEIERPVLVLTSRVPRVWARRRLQAHHGKGLSCRHKRGANVFNLQSCLAVSNESHVHNTVVLHGELAREHGVGELQSRFERYDDYVRKESIVQKFSLYRFCPI